jgi:hypothetical protein
MGRAGKTAWKRDGMNDFVHYQSLVEIAGREGDHRGMR